MTIASEHPRTGIGTGTATGIGRRFTTDGVDPYDEVEWDRRDARLVDHRDGSVIFEQLHVEVPADWSQNATNICAQKYFRGTLGSPDRESSVRQLIDRIVGAITAWNSPTLLMAYKLAPALAAGCTFVLKPPDVAPVSALAFARITEQVGIPRGVFNVVTGDGETGAALASHPDVDKIAFTGSPGVGKLVANAAADHLTPVALELGGKSAQIVFPDADLKVFLVAGLEARARRRLLQDFGVDPSPDEIVAETERIEERDRTDSDRELSPLRRPEDAFEVDTTTLSFEEQVSLILRQVKDLTAL